MSIRKIQSEFTLDIARLISFADQNGVELTFGEAYRTNDQQELYFHGKTIRVDEQIIELKTGVRKTRTMKSDHLVRLAVDFNFFIDGILTYDNKNEKLALLGDYWCSLNPKNYWGGFFKSFNDSPHFGRKQ